MYMDKFNVTEDEVKELRAEETRKKLIDELNTKYAKTGSFFDLTEDPGDPVVTFPSPIFEKPKMFEPVKINIMNEGNPSFEIPEVRGLGFKDTTINEKVISEEKNTSRDKPVEIYDMKKLIQSNPEGMRTLSIEPKTVKAQFALVKRREWQDILFEDVDWFREVDLTAGIKKIFHSNFK